MRRLNRRLNMTEEHDVLKELSKLAKAIHEDGHKNSVISDDWFEAWALVMKRVSDGEEYSGELVLDCYDSLFTLAP